VHRCHYRLPPEPARRRHHLEHASCHAHDRLISPLDDAILFRRVRCGQVPLNPLLGAIVKEGQRCEITTTVHAERAKLSLSVGFCPRLELHEWHHGLILGPQQRHPHIVAEVIDKEEDVPVATWCHRRHWPTEITMDQLQPTQ
jgi:hypothetical protein